MLFTTENIAVRPLRKADLPTLLAWLSDSRLTDLAWGEGVPWDACKVEAAFGGKTDGQGTVQGCIIELDGAEVGYIQYYPLDADAYRFTAEVPFECFAGGHGVDIFLGPPEFWGQGLGPRVVDALTRYLFAHCGASVVCADPEERNARSVSSWLKAGFSEAGRIADYDDPRKTSILMARYPGGEGKPMETHSFEGIIIKNPDMDAAYVCVPDFVKAALGSGRIAVHATFDGEAYAGQVVKMGTPGYIIGIRKDIRAKIGKQAGETVMVTLRHREVTPPAYTTVEAYIATFEGEVRERMARLRDLILTCAPGIGEKISWGMATFTLNGNLLHFAGQKKHLGFHPGASGVAAFKGRLGEFKHSKGTIQLSYDQPMPWGLLEEIVRFRVTEQQGEG